MDAWEHLMETARDRLSLQEGSEVSWREIVRRAGFGDADFGRVSYHLRPRSRSRGQHFVPGWLIDALEPVLPVSRAQLDEAAARAAGYYIESPLPEGLGPSILPAVLAVLQDERLPAAERERLGLELVGAITRTLQKLRTVQK